MKAEEKQALKGCPDCHEDCISWVVDGVPCGKKD
jgi:hypothetical protein